MIHQLLYKWFGLSDPPCMTCEVLRTSLENSERERRDLLHRLLEKDRPEPLAPSVPEEMKAIPPQFTPWRVRQQMLEQEDRKTAELMKRRSAEISSLESELGIPNAVQK